MTGYAQKPARLPALVSGVTDKSLPVRAFKNLLDWFLAEVMIDAKDGIFREAAMQDPVEFDGGGEVMIGGRFDHYLSIPGGTASGGTLDDRGNTLGGMAR